LLAKMEAIGNRFVVEDRNLRIIPDAAHRATDIETLPFPGFPTDMQAQLMALLTLSEGNSVITETLFENRFQHVAELCRMGADIRVKGNNAIIRGVSSLSGAPVEATDLRAGAALVVAGLAAEGKTIVTSIQYIDRGYEDLDFKLRAIGARIQRLDQGIEVPELVTV
jgi:UDP-N-acetylglucosamine 1-carboxyvinyltransferase